uniref:Uncharacterized protein n=1 Tax=Trypanosoma congolense (strain IL3000) TaxID=1068625 RepID=G0UZQ0_TRYCI|nr:conserved hypothetical protein [Trypanosoma congolense IL3000]
MEPGTRDVLVTTVERLVSSVGISADCSVECHAFDGDEDVKTKLTYNTRILEVDGHVVTDSAKLRDLLQSRMGCSVYITFEKIGCDGPRIEICGMESNVQPNAVTNGDVPQHLSEVLLTQLTGSSPPEDQDEPSSLLSSASSSPRVAALPLSPTSALLPNVVRRSSEPSEGTRDRVVAVSLPSGFSLPELSARANAISGKEQGSFTVGLTPSLLEFERLEAASREMDWNSVAEAAPSGKLPMSTSACAIRRSLANALDSVGVGLCVICVYQDVNPIAELELTALRMDAVLITVDLGTKLRQRLKPEEFGEQFKAAMTQGKWFVMVNAHKSISTCNILEDLLKEAKERSYEGFHPKSRVIICLESHPHFPPFFISQARVVRFRSSLSMSMTVLSDTMTASLTRNRVVTGSSVWNPKFGKSKLNEAAQGCKGKRRVRINAAVEVVDIAPREVLDTQLRREEQFDDGLVVLCATVSGVPGDKFLCVDVAGESGRFAIGSSLGNVYFVDRYGKSLLQTHVHESSIWDLSFHDKLHFASACEDGTCVEWRFEADDSDDIVLTPSLTASLGNDAYCVTYVNKQASEYPFLLLGGLRHELLLLRGGTLASTRIPIQANAQAVDAFARESVALVGGSDGSLVVIDVGVGMSVMQSTAHSRKLPALTVRDDSHFFTGSFDSTILSWDYRMPKSTGGAAVSSSFSAAVTNTLKLKGYVTGLHVDDVYMAASVGENLYLWDVRKLGEVLGGQVNAWKGLSRGVRVDSAERCIVTASQDGCARVWGFA